MKLLSLLSFVGVASTFDPMLQVVTDRFTGKNITYKEIIEQYEARQPPVPKPEPVKEEWASKSQVYEGLNDACNPHQAIDADDIYTKSDSGYDKARLDQYGVFLGTKQDASQRLMPALLVKCSTESHVVSTVNFARRCGYKVAVRSGGHSYTASSSCNFKNCLQIDLQNMDDIRITGSGVLPGKAMMKVQPGIRLKPFAVATLKSFVAVPHGICTRVAVGGHLQSSAKGFLSQTHGSGMDLIRSFRMVLANGTVKEFKQDSDVYKASFGSAPGSWGIVTEFTIEPVMDKNFPFSRVQKILINYSKSSFIKVWKHAQFIAKDQEAKNLRDMKVVIVVGPPSDGERDDIGILVVGLWSGIDSGLMTSAWQNRYLQPFYDLPHKLFPNTLDVPMSMSLASRMLVDTWVNHNDRYAVHSMHSNYWWDDKFFEIMAEEVDQRVKMGPTVYPSFQFLPVGHNAQWAKNAGLNSITWRDVRPYVDSWMFTSDESRYDEMVERMVNFRDKTRKYWEYKTGVADRSTWMSPPTTYPFGADLRNPQTAKSYFPDANQFKWLQGMKRMLDPTDLFHNKATLPPN